MALDAETRIARRTRAADKHRQEEGFFGRIMNRVGLAAANTWDRMMSPLDDGRIIFAGMTVSGMLRGALYGGIAAFAAAGLGFVAAGMGATVLAAAVVVGAVGFGMYDGQKSLEDHFAKRRTLSDSIAEKTGAVSTPGHMRLDNLTPQERLAKSGRDPKLQERVVAQLTESEPNGTRFADAVRQGGNAPGRGR